MRSVIAARGDGPLSREEHQAAALQQRYGFRFPLPQILQRRLDHPPPQTAGAIITDDFAPADVYDVMGKDWRR